MDQKPIKKTVFLRVGALGDLLVGLAALVETLGLFDGANTFVVGNALWLEILQPGYFPAIKGLFILDHNKASQGKLYSLEKDNWVLSQTKMSLRQFLKDADVFVNTRIDSLRFAWPALGARVAIRIGSAPWPFSLLYTHNSPWLGKDPLIHERDNALRILEAYTRSSVLVSQWQARGGLPATKIFNKALAEQLARSQWKKYVLINPTASRPEKAWSKERFRELVWRLQECGWDLRIVGAPHETEWLNFVADGKVPVVQPPNILALMDLVAGAKILLTNTSSMQFIAASSQTPTVTLMGRARPEIWGPLGLEDKVIRGQMDVKAQGLSQTEQEVAAFHSIGVDLVFNELIKALR